MTDLKSTFEKMDFSNVATYIQSGNVIFMSSSQDTDALTRMIEATLTKQFGYNSKIVLVSRVELTKIVNNAPSEFGSDKERYRYDVLFLKAPLTAQAALKEISLKEGVDEVHAGEGVLYFRRLISKAEQSRLNKLVAMPIYKNVTIRNWNTTTKLRAMMDVQT
jgi:uncharacterized protein (DUF1697 family)